MITNTMNRVFVGSGLNCALFSFERIHGDTWYRLFLVLGDGTCEAIGDGSIVPTADVELFCKRATADGLLVVTM